MEKAKFLEYLDRPEVRKAILAESAKESVGNWQNVLTPDWIVRDMVGQVEDKPELRYCVLFNLEFLEELVFVRGISRERIMFMTDSRFEMSIAISGYGVKTMRTRKELGVKRTIERVVRKARKAFYEGKEMPKTNNLVVFGNPPYQSADGGFSRSAKPIYNEFVQAVVQHLNPRFHSFIIPSRWMLGGKGLDSFREWMLSGAPVNQEDKAKHISNLVDFKSATDVFEAEIAGGVCYYLWDREHNGPCMFGDEVRKLDEYDVFIRDNKALSILRKVQFKHKAKWMDGTVSASKPYGFRADTVPMASGTPCWFKQSQGLKFVDPKIVKDTRNDLGKWKVLAARAPIAGQTDFNKAISFFTDKNLFIAKPNECCSETYLVLNSFNTKNEAENFHNYVKTRFFRFMLLLRVVSQDIPSDRYAFVPDLGDYSKPVTDADLYKRFGLTPEEIAYIESKIKALPNGEEKKEVNGDNAAA